MKQYIKNILVVLLCLVVTIPVSLSFLNYYQQLRVIKKEVKRELIAHTPKSELVEFSFLMQDEEFQNLNWHHGHEFEWHQKMYDIVEADTLGSMVYYLCFPDKQETALNDKFRLQLSDRYAHDNDKKNKSVQICSIFLSLYSQNHHQIIPALDYISLTLFSKANIAYSSPCLVKLGPPPKAIV